MGKRCVPATLAVLALVFSSCAFLAGGGKAARKGGFHDMFPAAHFTLGASDAEAAGEYLNMARSRFAGTVSGKRLADGRIGVLTGHAATGAPYTLVIGIYTNETSFTDRFFSDESAAEAAAALKRADWAVFYAFVFSENASISVVDLYLARGINEVSSIYEAVFPQTLSVLGADYTVTIMSNWKITDAFNYLAGDAGEEK